MKDLIKTCLNEDNSINHELHALVLNQMKIDAIKMEKGNCLAARRYRVYSALYTRESKIMRANSPIKYYSKNKQHLGRK